MSQRAVEAVLGRLVTDSEFRVRFFSDPAEVCRENDIVLTATEKAALLRIDVPALHRLAVTLDSKIVRAAVATVPSSHGAEQSNRIQTDRLKPQPATGLGGESLGRRS